MGIIRSCFGQPSPERLPQDQSSSKQSKDEGAGLMTSIMEFMKTSCFGVGTETKRDLQGQETKKQPPVLHPSKDKEVTLQECPLSSPIPGSCDGDDQFHVLKQSSSNKVYPSLAADFYANYNPSHRYSTERLLRGDEVNSSEVDFSSLRSRNQTGKTRKRVSFKSPEEADIHIYNPPDEEFGE